MEKDEQKRQDLNSAYDLIRGYFASVQDVHERALLIRNLELLHETAWQTVAPSAEEPAISSKKPENERLSSASTAGNTTR